MTVNKVTLLGRLGQDPEIRMTQSGQQVATISIATSERWVKDGKKEEKVTWHRVVLWGKLAELTAKWLKKGREVYIEGKLENRSWEDQSGQKRYTTEIIARELHFVGPKPEGSPRQDGAPPPSEPPYYESHMGGDSDDVPF